MSLKSVELQIAIPKTFDAGKIAEQKQQQADVNKHLANSLIEREAMKLKETVSKSEQTMKTDKDGQRQNNEEMDKRERQQEEKEKKSVHPFKGALIDFTG